MARTFFSWVGNSISQCSIIYTVRPISYIEIKISIIYTVKLISSNQETISKQLKFNKEIQLITWSFFGLTVQWQLKALTFGNGIGSSTFKFPKPRSCLEASGCKLTCSNRKNIDIHKLQSNWKNSNLLTGWMKEMTCQLPLIFVKVHSCHSFWRMRSINRHALQPLLLHKWCLNKLLQLKRKKEVQLR